MVGLMEGITPMTESPVLREVRDGVGVITLNRPRVRNALNRAMSEALRDAAQEFAARDDIQVVMVRGEGPAFCAGADLKERLLMSAEETAAHTTLIHQAVDAIAGLPVPTIAAVHGACLAGGAEVALACDLRFCSDRATFGFPEVKRGIFPGAGGVVRLPRLLGPARAAELIFTGRMIGAQEALSIGLVDRVTTADELGSQVASFAAEIRGNAPLALRAAKQALQLAADLPLAEALQAVAELRKSLDNTADYREGLAAFAEARKPQFRGR